MSKAKKIVAILIVSFILVVLGMQTNASSGDPLDPFAGLMPTDPNAIIANQIEANQIIENAIIANQIMANQIEANQIEANRIASNSIMQPEVDKTPGGVNNDLPQTGVTEDITVMFFIIVCVVSALYAYSKIRKYNV